MGFPANKPPRRFLEKFSNTFLEPPSSEMPVEVRWWGVAPCWAQVGVLMLLTLPILDTQVAVAGYADLWLAGFLVAAVGLLLRFARERRGVTLVAGLLFLLAMPLVKREGAIYVAGLLPALAVLFFKPARVAWVVAVATLGLVVITIVGVAWDSPWGPLGLSLERYAVPGLGSFDLGLQPVAKHLLRHLAVWDSWHLFWYVLAAVLALASWRSQENQLTSFLFIVLAGLLLPVLVAFFVTAIGAWVIQGTLVNRVLLHTVPTALLAGAIMLDSVVARRPEVKIFSP